MNVLTLTATRRDKGLDTINRIIRGDFKSLFLTSGLAVMFFFVSSLHVFATVKTFTGSGNFSDPTLWSGGTLPAANDVIKIDGTCTIDNSALTDNVGYGPLTIGNASVGIVYWPLGGTNRLNVTNINASFVGANVIDMTNGGRLIVRGNFTTTYLTLTPGLGVVETDQSTTLSAFPILSNVAINTNGTLSASSNLTITGNLEVLSGTLNVGGINLTVGGTTTITGTLILSSATGTKSFKDVINNGTISNTANEAMTINGSLTNNGIFTIGTGMVTFTGATNNTISGTTVSTAFGGGITVDKGIGTSNILDVQSVITIPAGGLVLTNGTFKLSSSSTITPFTVDIATLPYRIPLTAGLWVNGGTVSTTSDVTAGGLVRVSNGTFNVGDASNESLISSFATIIIDGGVCNIAGRLMEKSLLDGINFTMSAGTLTVAAIGSTSSLNSPFHLVNLVSSFNMSGGTIVIRRQGGSNLGYSNTAGVSSVTGGTLQIGDASTPASQTILINTNVPVGNLTINGLSSTVGQLITNSLTVKSAVTITSGTLNANNLNLTVGGNWTTASAAGFTCGSGTVTFNGGGSQFINGTAASQTFNNLVISKLAGSTLTVNGSTTTLTTNNFTETTGNFTAPATMNINVASTSSVILSAGTFTAGANINITGDWSNNGGTFVPGTGILTFSGSNSQVINGSAPAQVFNNIVLALNNNKVLSVAGSTTDLTVQDFTETTGDFTAGAAAVVSINGNLTITTGIFTTGALTNVGGNFNNEGSYTSALGNTLAFTGATSTTIIGAGNFLIFNITLNKSAKTTPVDIQTSKFITGINSGNVYNFTFTQGTWKHNTSSVLNDCHNNGVATALTIPFNVVIEVPLGTMNLAKSGVSGSVILSGKLSVNGGIVKVEYAQALNTGMDFRYKVNGGTPQLYISNGGDLLCGAGFNGNALTDYIDFNMSGATSFIHLADMGYSLSATFRLNNVVGGSTVMTDGIIAMESACNAAQPDIDMGGGNISPYSVTGGTVRFGYTGTQGGATWFGIQYYTATNYPNIDFQAGIAKVAQPWASDGQTFNVLSIHINSSMTLDMTVANPDPNVVFLSSNGTYALSIQGIILLGTGGVVFKGNNVNQLITGTATSYIFNNMTVNMTPGNLTYTGGSITALNVANYTQTQGDYTPPANFNVSGNWTHDAGSFNPGVNMVTFNGAGTQTINGTLATKTFYNVTIAKTAGLLNTGGGTTAVTTNDLTATTGNFTAPATLNINGNLLLSSGTFTAGTTINIKGNWTNNGGIFVPGTKTVIFNGTGTKTIGGTVAPSFYNLTINTAASTDKVQLTNDATTTSVLTLTNGVFDLNSKTIFVTNGASAAITRTGGYILSEKTNNSSKICWTINFNGGAHIYPFGTAAGIYIPFTLTREDGDFGNVTVATYPTSYLNTPYPVTPILVTNMNNSTGSDNSANVVDRFWQIDKTGVTAVATLTFTATPAEIGTITSLKAQRYESSTNTWQWPLPGQTNPTATTVTVSNVTNFSPWTLSGNGAMLPIELLNFNAVTNETQVDLNWTTASELNNDYFTVEKTVDLVNYKEVAIVNGAGNSTHLLTYSTPDIHPYSGVSYYRLKQTDFNGTETYSNVVSVSFDASADQLLTYPNPVIGSTITLVLPNDLSDEVQVIIYSMSGQEVVSNKVYANGNGSFTINTGQSGKLTTGVYLLALSSEAGSYQQKLIIQ